LANIVYASSTNWPVLLNIIIEFFGGTGIAVLADERYVTYGIIAAGLWPQTAYCMILYLTGLNSVDGCNNNWCS